LAPSGDTPAVRANIPQIPARNFVAPNIIEVLVILMSQDR
jgi:hypothetical protein